MAVRASRGFVLPREPALDVARRYSWQFDWILVKTATGPYLAWLRHHKIRSPYRAAARLEGRDAYVVCVPILVPVVRIFMWFYCGGLVFRAYRMGFIQAAENQRIEWRDFRWRFWRVLASRRAYFKQYRAWITQGPASYPPIEKPEWPG